MNKTILIIDDDRKLNNLLRDYLEKFGFKVTAATHPDEGLHILKRELPDLIILDIMLPDMDGFEVCKRIRKEYFVPIIMLTARGEVTDRVVGLELGADDYLPKPFEPRELVARIQSVLRRSSEHSKSDVIALITVSLATWAGVSASGFRGPPGIASSSILVSTCLASVVALSNGSRASTIAWFWN